MPLKATLTLIRDYSVVIPQPLILLINTRGVLLCVALGEPALGRTRSPCFVLRGRALEKNRFKRFHITTPVRSGSASHTIGLLDAPERRLVRRIHIQRKPHHTSMAQPEDSSSTHTRRRRSFLLPTIYHSHRTMLRVEFGLLLDVILPGSPGDSPDSLR